MGYEKRGHQREPERSPKASAKRRHWGRTPREGDRKSTGLEVVEPEAHPAESRLGDKPERFPAGRRGRGEGRGPKGQEGWWMPGEDAARGPLVLRAWENPRQRPSPLPSTPLHPHTAQHGHQPLTTDWAAFSFTL